MNEVCEICGKPATCLVLDLTRIPNDELGMYDFIPENKIHKFCIDHQRNSITYDTNGHIV